MFKKKINQNETIKYGIVAGLLEVGFIVLVGCFFLAAETMFPAKSGVIIFGIMSFLILLVLGVAMSGLLIAGYPAYCFLNKKYQEGLTFFSSVCGTLLAIFILLVFIRLILF